MDTITLTADQQQAITSALAMLEQMYRDIHDEGFDDWTRQIAETRRLQAIIGEAAVIEVCR